MHTHYETLGIGLSATAAEIKAAYRQLAVRYHPDRNSDPMADVIIKEINEAYHVLSDVKRKSLYDMERYWPVDVARGPKRVRKSSPHPAPMDGFPYTKEHDMEMLLLRYQSVVRRFSIGTLLFCTILFIDHMAAPIETNEIIVNKYCYRDAEVFETALGKYPIPLYNHVQYAVGQHVEVASSPLLRIPFYITTRTPSKTFLQATIYGNFSFAPLLLAICSLLYFYERLKPHIRLTLGVLNCLLFFITTVLIFSIRIIY